VSFLSDSWQNTILLMDMKKIHGKSRTHGKIGICHEPGGRVMVVASWWRAAAGARRGWWQRTMADGQLGAQCPIYGISFLFLFFPKKYAKSIARKTFVVHSCSGSQ
jgi:hypothetical protein